jgi:hypothetical protein
MAVVAVLLGTVVAANLSGGGGAGAPADPRASFTFDADNESVLVTHFGGDELNASRVYIESGERGRLGNFDGTDGRVCAENVTHLVVGVTCTVADARYERLYIVWEGADNRTLILARRLADPTPTPTGTPTVTPTAGPTPTPSPTGTPTGTTAVNQTPTSTAANATATPSGTATSVPTPTPSPTPTGTPTNTPTTTISLEPNEPLPTTTAGNESAS